MKISETRPYQPPGVAVKPAANASQNEQPASGTRSMFVSYAREDREFAVRLTEDLRAAGVKVWRDESELHRGQLFDEVIAEAIVESSEFVLIVSPDAVRSQFVMDELNLALEEGKTVVPVLYRQCKMPFRIRRRQYVDFTSSYEEGLAALARTRYEPPKPIWWGRLLTSGAGRLLRPLLAVLVVLVGIAVYFYWYRPSKTSFTVTFADNTVLYLKVSNTGLKSSTLQSYRLQFLPAFQIEDAVLDLAQPYKQEARHIIAPGRTVTIGLTVKELELRKPGGSELYTKDEIKSLLRDPLSSNKQVMLQVEVKESNDPRRGFLLIKPRPYHTYTDEFAAQSIREFVLGRMSG